LDQARFAGVEGMSLEGVQRDLIVQALRQFNWNQSRAAKFLGITRKTLLYRITKYGIEKQEPETPSSPKELSSAAGKK
jgi:transcriptional regulator with GAF, ATPase, and Fis domain